jgi:predicted TIM-barrel enzyme
MLAIGYSGITNVPTAGLYDGKFRRHIDATGLGYPKEVELIEKCNAKDVFTVAYVFNPEEAQAMAAAGADIIGAHVGLTIGGTIGAQEAMSLDEACKATEAMYEAAVKENPNVIVVSHGGPFEDAESVQYVFDRVPVHGYLGASSIERLPVEKALKQVVAEFKGLKLTKRA